MVWDHGGVVGKPMLVSNDTNHPAKGLPLVTESAKEFI